MFSGESRLCKRALFAQFRSETEMEDDALNDAHYAAMKDMSMAYMATQRKMHRVLAERGYGIWLKKPPETKTFTM